MKLHQSHLSGNCYKVRLAAHHLGLPLTLVDVDVMGGETRRPPFLARNPNGRVPTLELDDGETLSESDAILFYLAEGTHLMPEAHLDRARVMQWMFFEQYSHEPYIAVALFWLTFAPKDQLEAKRHLIPEWHARGNAALGVMETHLATAPWFGAPRYSIGDIALYAYTHSAAEGGFDLAKFARVSDWLQRVKAQPRHLAMADRI